MATMASSSSMPAGPRPRQRSRKDVFKPRFPFDPFAGASAAALGEPWFLKIDALLSATALQRRNVFFVLGAPSLQELAPLLQSRRMAKSLVILVTHNPPDIPGIVIPTVRVLRLSQPLALEDAGAVRFVNVLEWAERVSRSWRKHGGLGVLELTEENDIHGELTPPSVLRFGSQSTPTSPGSSSTLLTADSQSSSSRPSSIAGSFFARKSRAPLPPPDPAQRPFDVLINFLPEKVSDKALLKNSILVTTISRPFLTSSVHPSPPTLRTRTSSSSSSARLRPRSILGAFSRSSTSVYMPPTPPSQSGESLAQFLAAPPGKALLIHLLPVAAANAPTISRRKLVESMESFLLSFAFQSGPASPFPPGHHSSSGSDPLERARPYVMHASTFCDVVGAEPGMVDDGDWTVADIVLSGTLDADTPATSSLPGVPPVMSMSASVGAVPKIAGTKATKRAWIAASVDLVIMPADDASPNSTGISAYASVSASVSAPSEAYAGMGSHNRPFEKTRSTSTPLLSSDWYPNGRPFSHPQHIAQYDTMPTSMSMSMSMNMNMNMGRPGKMPSNVNTYTSPSLVSSGLPTPPHSDEDTGSGSGSDAFVEETSQAYGFKDSTQQKHRDGRAGGHGDGHGLGGSAVALVRGHDVSIGSAASEKKQKWKFWRRLQGQGHAHAQPATVKA